MLHEFLAAHRNELVESCRAKAAKRPSRGASAAEHEYGIPILIGQLIATLRAEQTATTKEPDKLPADIGTTARKHGNELLLHGFTIDQVVHDYGDLCQAITELAHQAHAQITVEEFHTFNRCLDDAIADAVTEFGRRRDQTVSAEGVHTMNERLGCLAHELRNLLGAATLAFRAIKSGHVALSGATGAVVDRSLDGLRVLIDRSLAEVRLTDGLQVHREPISIRDIFDEVRVLAAMEAEARGVTFTTPALAEGLAIDADRQMISSAIANLLQNAFKFTRSSGHVSLSAHAAAERVIIEVADECGGLPEGRTEDLFRPFEQRGGDRTGLGLGLSISRRGVEANGGKLHVRDLPGTGCVFTIDLPGR